jgi:hypothetical protein
MYKLVLPVPADTPAQTRSWTENAAKQLLAKSQFLRDGVDENVCTSPYVRACK